MKNDEIISYWTESSEQDFEAMKHLFQKGDYHWSLFVGHLILEKLLKAHYVKQMGDNPPFIHDLLRLSEKGGMTINEEQKDMLDTISGFNIITRYNDYKQSFYRKCTKEFTTKWIKNIKELRAWIKEQLSKR
jgi:HEPN domain-containing protein